MKIVLASHNAGKIREFETALQPQNIQLIPQAELGVSDIEETGLSFVENALLKARHASNITNLPALADDSGLVVPALNGEPGIYSARYAGKHGDAKKNIEKLLQQLINIKDEERAAYFYCVLVLMLHPHDPTPLICAAKWQGHILRIPQGEQGFGYDPIFYVDAEKKSAAELNIEIKNKISHRGLALQQLLQKLSGTLS